MNSETTEMRGKGMCVQDMRQEGSKLGLGRLRSALIGEPEMLSMQKRASYNSPIICASLFVSTAILEQDLDLSLNQTLNLLQ